MMIIPAIYPESFEEIADKLYALHGITDFVQIVFCDGSYGLRKSWEPAGKEILPSSFKYEADLVLTSWREYLIKINRMSIRSVVIHIDEFTDDDYTDLFKLVHTHELRLGISISNEVSIDVLINAINKIKASEYFSKPEDVFIQVTGLRSSVDNKISFDERVLHRIRVLKKLFPKHLLQVSGRITPETAGVVKQSGADTLVSSSYIFGHEDLQEAINLLMQAVAESLAKQEVHDALVQEEVQKLSEKVKSAPPHDANDAIVVVEQPVKVVQKPQKHYKASEDDIVYETQDDFLTRE